MRTWIVLLIIAGSLVAMLNAKTRGQSEGQDMGAAMQRWIDAGTPGENHRFLVQFVGKWKTTTKAWMTPGQPPATSHGEAETESVMGGRYFISRSKDTLVGQPRESLFINGYNNTRKQFFLINVDSTSTGWMIAKGTLSQDKKKLTYVCEMDEPMTGEIGKSFKSVVEFIDDDHHDINVYEVLYGEPTRVVQISYERVQ